MRAPEKPEESGSSSSPRRDAEGSGRTEAEFLAQAAEAFERLRVLDPARRSEPLAALDPVLRREVEELLAASETAVEDALSERRIRARANGVPWGVARESIPEEAPPERIGGFRVLRRLGAGGMGVVYEAEQETPHRRVAVKLVRPGLAFGERLRRFRQEAEILGRLQHPGIAQIFEFGTADVGHGEQPYFVMELVTGEPLLAHSARAGLDRRARLALVAELCDAVQHAHERGVVHRDLKPDNVLVDASGRAKVLDFGVARVRADDVPLSTIHTAQGEIVGTLTHMAPEQLTGNPDAVGPAADVYALGVIAFELLSGRLPHEVAGLSLTQAARRITEVDPPRLGTLDHGLRGDLETIVAKALEPDPARRYVSPAALASDLRRFLASEPIAARPAGPLYRARKFTRRHPALVGGIVVLLVGIAASGFFATRAERNRRTAEWQTYRSALAAASVALRGNEQDVAARALDSAPDELRGWEWRYLEGRLGPPSTLLAEGLGLLDGMCVASAEDVVATARSDGERTTLRLFSVTSRELLLECELGLTSLHGLAFREGDQELVVCGTTDSGDLHALFVKRPSGAVVRDERLMSGPFPRNGFTISPRGERVAQTQGENVYVVSTDGSEPVRTLPPLYGPSLRFGAGGRLLSGFESNFSPIRLVVFDLETAAVVASFPARHGLLAPLQARVITQRPDHLTEVCDLEPAPSVRATARWRIEEQPEDTAFSMDGNRVLSLSFGRLRLWDVGTGELLGPYGGVLSVTRFAFLPAGDRFVTAGEDGELRLWPVEPAGEAVLRGHASFVYSLALSPDGKLLASGGWDGYVGQSGSLRVWEAASGIELFQVGEPDDYLTSVAWAKNGRELLLGWGSCGLVPSQVVVPGSKGPGPDVLSDSGPRCRVERMSLEPRALMWSLPLRPFQLGVGPIDERVYVTDDKGRLTVVEGNTGKVLAAVDIAPTPVLASFGLSPDGLRIVCPGPEHSLQLLEASNLKTLHTRPAHSDAIQSIAFSPDGRQVFSASEDGTVRASDAATLAAIGDPWHHDSGVLCVRPSPSGERIATGARDGLVRIWSPAGEELLRLEGHTGYVKDLVWSPDGETLYSASGDTTIRVWSAAARQ